MWNLTIWQSIRFWIQLYIRRDIVSRFSFSRNRGVGFAGIHLENNDALFNLTCDDVTMNKDVPWRGAREKNEEFFRMLQQQLSKPGDTILDCKAATGNAKCEPTSIARIILVLNV